MNKENKKGVYSCVVNTKHTDYFDTPYDEIGQLSTNKGNNKITEFRTIFQRER
jgi:hypothetical protein